MCEAERIGWNIYRDSAIEVVNMMGWIVTKGRRAGRRITFNDKVSTHTKTDLLSSSPCGIWEKYFRAQHGCARISAALIAQKGNAGRIGTGHWGVGKLLIG